MPRTRGVVRDQGVFPGKKCPYVGGGGRSHGHGRKKVKAEELTRGGYGRGGGGDTPETP